MLVLEMLFGIELAIVSRLFQWSELGSFVCVCLSVSESVCLCVKYFVSAYYFYLSSEFLLNDFYVA